jgi:hypothetical protein
MAKWYADDLRRKLLQAYDRGEGTLEQLAERFCVSAPWVWKISAQRKRSGQMERVEQARLRGWVQAQPDLTLAELQQKLAKDAPPAPKHRPPVASAAPEGSRFKKSLHASKRNTEANQQRRQVFQETLGGTAPERLIFLDESGVTSK